MVLLSGGLDSATTLAIAHNEGYACHALTASYGQRHAEELRAAERVAQALGAREHLVIRVDPRLFGGSALTTNLPVPKGPPATRRGIPVTYVPARNTVFLAHALAWAESLGARDIFLGVNAIDYSGYPDCRPGFVSAFERVANLATRAGVEGQAAIRIHAPLVDLTKAQIVARGLELGVDFALTWSCYDPDPRGRACGECDACHIRRAGFAANGLEDPLEYAC